MPFEHRCPVSDCDTKRFTQTGLRHHLEHYHGDSIERYERQTVIEYRK
jgi:hypothetical protein